MWGWVTSIEVIMIMKFDMICNKVFDVESDTFGNPVLYTVVLYATFWSRLGSSGSKGKKVDLSYSEQLLRVVFSTF